MPNRQALTRLALLAFICLVGCTQAARAQSTPPSPLPSPEGYVNDYANVIEPAAKQRLEAILKNLDQRANVEFAVVTVQTLGGRDIFDYSLAVMRGWGIGSKEKGGLLLLFSVQERKGFMQVSRHLEGDLPDSLVGEIGRKYMRPQFQQGNYSQGLLDGVQSITATLAQQRGFSVDGLDPGYAVRAPQRPTGTRRTRPQGGMSVCGLGFIILIVLFFLLASRGRRGGGGGGGCLNLLLFNALLNSGRGNSGWGGGGFGGSSGGGGWGSGGGGFGGFSGGGGDAGGGGAGFDW